MFGLATSVAISNAPKTLRCQSCRVGRQQTWPTTALVRRFFVLRDFDAVLFLPVADGGFDGVFGEHGTVNLDGRERKLAHDVRVLDRKRLFDRLALDPLGSERGAGDGRPATEGLKLGFFNDLGVRINFHLQIHYITALRRYDETRAYIGVLIRDVVD